MLHVRVVKCMRTVFLCLQMPSLQAFLLSFLLFVHVVGNTTHSMTPVCLSLLRAFASGYRTNQLRKTRMMMNEIEEQNARSKPLQTTLWQNLYILFYNLNNLMSSTFLSKRQIYKSNKKSTKTVLKTCKIILTLLYFLFTFCRINLRYSLRKR